MKKFYRVSCDKYRKFEEPKIYLRKKHYLFLSFAVSARVKMKNFYRRRTIKNPYFKNLWFN